MSSSAKSESKSIQVTLDSRNVDLIAGLETKRTYGENKKEITNNILREWFKKYLKHEDIKDDDLITLGLLAARE